VPSLFDGFVLIDPILGWHSATSTAGLDPGNLKDPWLQRAKDELRGSSGFCQTNVGRDLDIVGGLDAHQVVGADFPDCASGIGG